MRLYCNTVLGKSFCRQGSGGFTFLEVVLVLALVGILAGISLPFWRDLLLANQLNSVGTETVQALRRAQAYALAGRTNSAWGVAIDSESNEIILFRGPSFVSRTQEFDDVINLPLTITHTGTAEFLFEAGSGRSLAGGTAVFAAPNGETAKVSVNTQGLVFVE